MSAEGEVFLVIMPHSAGDQVLVCNLHEVLLSFLSGDHTSQTNRTRTRSVYGLQWTASVSEHDLDVKFLPFPKSWGFDNINTLVFALVPCPNRALFKPRAPCCITLDLKHYHEARSCYCVLFCARRDPR